MNDYQLALEDVKINLNQKLLTEICISVMRMGEELVIIIGMEHGVVVLMDVRLFLITLLHEME